jgi:hypothetical protein
MCIHTNGWVGGWVGGRVGGWMGGSDTEVTEYLHSEKQPPFFFLINFFSPAGTEGTDYAHSERQRPSWGFIQIVPTPPPTNVFSL